MRTRVSLALNWLASSGIRCADSNSAAQGGVNQGYNWRARRYPFVYSEITGYAVSTFSNAYRWTGNEGYVGLAQQAADFLLRAQGSVKPAHLRGAIPQGLSLPELQPGHHYYSFDAAMCLQGILDLNRVKPSSQVVASAEAIGNWLLQQMQREDGSFRSVLSTESDQSPETPDNVFGDGGCLHAKHAIGLVKLGQLTGDSRYIVGAERVCDWVLGLQDEDGAFRATEKLSQVVSHPHCYATEGLLFAYSTLGIERYRDAARKASQWLLNVQNRDGSINIEYKRNWHHMGRRVVEKWFPRRVTDATAQAVRIWLALYYLDNDPRYLDGCRRADSFLTSMQCTSDADRNRAGAFYFWPGHPVMFAWCTMFALHALHAVDDAGSTGSYQGLMAELF